MKLNPITALSDSLSKLVVEHGSAIITEKNLAFLRDQLTAAEKEISALTIRLEKSESENQDFKTQLQNLKKENQELKNKIETYGKSSHDNPLDEVSINVLKLLFRQDNLTAEQIAQSLSLTTLQMAKFHLEELRVMQMIKNHTMYREVSRQGAFGTVHGRQGYLAWSIDQKGRKYLITNKLTS
ncbi:MAG: hypothetical protein NTW44_07035 [Nitrospirae bacterium]|nr:hypothetical protein [Nitrospirota bacterium]